MVRPLIRGLILGAFFGMVTAASAAPAADSAPKRVAIANFGEHPQLAMAVAGFKRGLAKAGYDEGRNVVFTASHTNFTSSLVPQMLAKLQADRPDLVYTLTTPVSQIAKKQLAQSGVPIVFGAVTDPVAAQLVPSWAAGDDHITGASDMQDARSIVLMAKRLVPTAKVLGMPYNPGEANDVAFAAQLKRAAEAEGVQLMLVGVDSTNDIKPRMAAFAGKADVLYNSTSNLLQPATAAVAAVAAQLRIPLINADEGPVRKGLAVAAVAVGYEQVGYAAGQLAAKVLDGASTKTLAPSRPDLADHVMVISRKALASYKLEPSQAVLDCGCLVD